MVEVNANELFNALTGLKEELVEFKLSHQKDNADMKVEIAVMKNTNEQVRSDIFQLKSDVSNLRQDVAYMKQENAEFKGEQNKSNYFKDKMFWPMIYTVIMGLFINPLIVKLATPTFLQPQVQQQIQQITPTPNVIK